MTKPRLAQMDMHVDQTGTDDEIACINLIGLRVES